MGGWGLKKEVLLEAAASGAAVTQQILKPVLIRSVMFLNYFCLLPLDWEFDSL